MSRDKKSFDDIFRWAGEQDEYWIECAKLEFTEDLCAEMEKQEITRAELARRIGSSPAYVTKILGGNTNFTLASMVRIARALECELRTHLQAPGVKATWLEYSCGAVASARRESEVATTWSLDADRAEWRQPEQLRTEVA